MGSPFKTPEFRKLFAQWNKRLEASGHHEIENFNLREPTLKTFECFRAEHYTALRNEAVRAYYEMADVVLRTYPFKTREHRRIWELHCRGDSVRKIATQINHPKLSKSTICNVIVMIEMATGLRNGRDQDYDS